ncbi:hypothetical protein EZS27_034287 [termite gut metagenome]|uniref:Uncharacterized protein n=1 Tax=termite gut metagenome TaxID=433724 RepID=A0A5J4Q2W8_9ZZZZ
MGLSNFNLSVDDVNAQATETGEGGLNRKIYFSPYLPL